MFQVYSQYERQLATRLQKTRTLVSAASTIPLALFGLVVQGDAAEARSVLTAGIIHASDAKNLSWKLESTMVSQRKTISKRYAYVASRRIWF